MAYLLRTLQRLAPAGWEVSKPAKCVFWQDETGYQSHIQPDMLLQHAVYGTIVLNAKWKRPHGLGRAAEADLRQLFVYAQHFEATQARLLYPQAGGEASVSGEFVPRLFVPATPPTSGQQVVISCGVSYIQVGTPLGSQTVPNTDPAGYLRCSLAAGLPEWLPTLKQKPSNR